MIQDSLMEHFTEETLRNMIENKCSMIEFALCGSNESRIFKLYCKLLKDGCISNSELFNLFPKRQKYTDAVLDFFGLRKITLYWVTDKELKYLFI